MKIITIIITAVTLATATSCRTFDKALSALRTATLDGDFTLPDQPLSEQDKAAIELLKSGQPSL